MGEIRKREAETPVKRAEDFFLIVGGISQGTLVDDANTHGRRLLILMRITDPDGVVQFYYVIPDRWNKKGCALIAFLVWCFEYLMHALVALLLMMANMYFLYL